MSTLPNSLAALTETWQKPFAGVDGTTPEYANGYTDGQLQAAGDLSEYLRRTAIASNPGSKHAKPGTDEQAAEVIRAAMRSGADSRFAGLNDEEIRILRLTAVDFLRVADEELFYRERILPALRTVVQAGQLLLNP